MNGGESGLSPELQTKILATCTNLVATPEGQGLQLDGHVALVGANKELNLNVSDAALCLLREERTKDEAACTAVGGIRGRLMLKAKKNVPVRDFHETNLVFRHDAGNSDIPKRVRKHYTNILKGLDPVELAMVVHALESSGTAACVPLAIIKQQMSGGKLRCVVGSLGIRDSRGGDVYDWEYGGPAGTRWV